MIFKSSQLSGVHLIQKLSFIVSGQSVMTIYLYCQWICRKVNNLREINLSIPLLNLWHNSGHLYIRVIGMLCRHKSPTFVSTIKLSFHGCFHTSIVDVLLSNLFIFSYCLDQFVSNNMVIFSKVSTIELIYFINTFFLDFNCLAIRVGWLLIYI